MNVKDAVKALFKEWGGHKAVAHRFGLSLSRVYGFTDPATPEYNITFQRIAELTTPQATAAARHLASLAGGVFCPIPKTDGGPAMQLTTEAMRQHTEAITAIIEAHRDGTFTVEEATAAKKEIEEALCAMGALHGLCLAVLEKG